MTEAQLSFISFCNLFIEKTARWTWRSVRIKGPNGNGGIDNKGGAELKYGTVQLRFVRN